MSNIDQGQRSGRFFGRNRGVVLDIAQGFTTGSNVDGYNLTAVNIKFTNLTNSDVFKKITASIHERNNNNRPGNRVGNALVNPSFKATSTARTFAVTATFTAPSGGIDLEANTTYFFVIDATSNNLSGVLDAQLIGITSSNSEDSSSAMGWTIANNHLHKRYNRNSWVSHAQAARISVEGTAVVLPMVSVSLSDRDGVSRTAAGEQPYQEKQGTTGVKFDVSANQVLDDLTVCVRVTESGVDRVVSENEGIKTVTLSSGGQKVNGSGTHKVTWTDTAVNDPDSIVTVAVVAPDTAGCTGADNYTVSTTDPSDKIRILNDDSIEIELTSSDRIMTEGDASDTATLMVSLARRLYAGEVVVVPITLATTTGARLPGKANNDFTVSAAAASGQSGVSLATNAPAATPRVIFTGHDSNTVQTATVTLTPVANRDDDDMNHESITATLATNSVLNSIGLGTTVRGGASRHSSKIMASLALADDEALRPVVSVLLIDRDGVSRTSAGERPYNESLGTIGAVFDVASADQVLDDLTVCLRVTESGGDRVVSGNEGIKTVTLSRDSGFKGVGTYTVKWTDTAVDDRDSIVTVAAVAPDTAGCTGADTYTVSTTDPSNKIRILDDESTEVELTSSDKIMTEGDASDTATLTVSLARRLYAGEVVAVPILLKTTTGARLPGSKDNNENPNHDFTISAAAASGQSGVSLAANAPAATPRVVFTGHDSNTVQTATVTLTPVAKRDDGDDFDETITATVAEGGVLSATGLGTTVSGGVTRHSSNFMESLTLWEPTDARRLSGDTTAPQVTSIRRRKPSSSPTNADSLTWRVTFDEAVQNVDKTDFEVSGNPATTATITDVAQDGSTNAYDVTASGGDLDNYDGTVTLSFKSSHNIQDDAGNDLDSSTTPTVNNNNFVVDNTAPSVAIRGLSGTISGAVTATFTFSEPVTGFASGDIIVVASNGIKVSNFAVVTPGRIWSARITPSINGKLVTINVLRNAAKDKAGNGNTPEVAVANYIVRLSAPVGFTANPGDGQVSLSWSAPADSNAVAAVTQYQYRYQAESSSTPSAWKDVEDGADAGSDLSDETAWTVTGLTNGTRYTFELRAVNAAGNGATAAATATPASSDITAPQVTSIVRHSPSSSPTNADSLTWRVRFSEPVQNVDAADFQVSNTTALLTVSQVSDTNTYDVTASDGNLAGLNDTVTLSFNSSHNIQDRAGNDLDSNSTPTGSYVVDNTAPRVTSITRHSPSSSPTNADSLTWRVTFDEAVQNVDAVDFQVSNTTALLRVSQVSDTNTYDVTASDGNLASLNDTVRLSFNSSHNIQDDAGNKLAASGTNHPSYVVDNTAPSVAISGLSGTIPGAVTATFTFSEPVTGFASGDIRVTGSTMSNFAVVTPGRIWSARITPRVNGTAVAIHVLVNAAQDKAGNGSTAATVGANYIVRLSAPVGFTASPGDGQVSLSWSAPADSANSAAVQKYQYRYQAGSSVTTGMWKDVEDGADAGSDLSDETAWTVTGLTNGTRYTFELRAVNAAGNGATATATATPSSSDTTAPQVASIRRHSPSSSPTNADSLTWQVMFSEPVQNVDAADFQVSNTTALLRVSQVSDTDAYDVTASGGNLAGLDATVTLSFKSSHNIQDKAGNKLAASLRPSGTNHPSYVVDNTAPRVTSITRHSPSSSPTNADSLTWRVTFDEAVQNVDAADFQVSNTTALLRVSQVSDTNTYDVTASDGNLAGLNDTVRLSFKSSHNIQDDAGNDLDSSSTPTGSYVVDNTAPLLEISGLSGTISGVVTATFTFSEIVTGFPSSDIRVTGSTMSNFAVVTPGRIWSARITPRVNGTEVTINVPVNTAEDEAGNGSTAATARANYIVRLSAPVGFTASPGDGQVSLSWAAPADSNSVAAVQKYQYRYQAESSSTPSAWKDVEDGADAGSDLSDETALTVTGLTNGTRYTFELRAVNAAGNGATATATATPSSSDITAPQVTSIVRHSPSSSPTNADSLTWRVMFSEPVQNVDAADFQVSNTTALLTVSQVLGTNAYDVTASGGNLAGLNDTVTLSFKSSHNIQDRAGNDLDSSSTPTGSYVVDNTAPRVTSITRHSPSSSPTNADSLTWRVTFDGAVQNVDAADFQVSNTTALLTVSQVSGTNAYDVTASDGNLAGLNDTVRLSFKSSHNIQDRAGNKLAASLPPTGTNNNFFVVQNTSISPPTPPTTPTTPPVMPTPVVSISAGAPSVMEGDTVSFTLSITPPPEAGATIMVDTHVAEGGGVAASGQTGSRQVAISASGLASFTVATDDDTIYEPDGSITATVQAGAGYRPHSSNASAAVSVKDNDSPGLLDPRMMQGWLSRFGRTVSHQVVAALQDRFAADPPQPGLDLTVAGEALSSATPLAENQQVLSKALGLETVTAQQLVEDSSFSFSPEGEAGSAARFSIWGQGALSSFSGQQDRVSLDGDVSTPLMGAEWSAARWLAGAALSHSWGSGGYAGDNTVAGGDISSTLTGIFPYGRYRLTPRLGIWAVAGYGWGDLSLKPDGDDADYSPGITMTMGAVGVDGLLLDGGAEGLSLTTTADALLVQTTSEAVAGLASSDANISRLRLGLEATRPVPLANGASLFPSLELGIRQDRGDAETGFGMELGAGLAWADPERGISAELQGRTLLTHTEEEFQEQGLAISFAWEPNPTNRGPSLSVSHAVGATAEGGGMDALLSPTALEALDATSSRQHQFETKLAYGFPAFNDRLTLTTGVGLALSPDSRTYSLLWALAPYAQQPQTEPWQISLEGERQENSTATSSAEHSLGLRFSLLF